MLRSGGLQLISGGTDNHLMLVDVTPLNVTGKTAETVLEHCGITVNMNMIPYDQRKPLDPSGIRIGTPALTTRGMGPDEMRRIGAWMLQALRSPEDAALHERIRGEVRELCAHFPVPAAALADGMNRCRADWGSRGELMAESRILIADDNAANCELLEAYLMDIDCEVQMAVDGQDTLDKVATFHPDVILLDIMMPKLNGFEVCRKIKDDPGPAGSWC